MKHVFGSFSDILARVICLSVSFDDNFGQRGSQNDHTIFLLYNIVWENPY